MFASGRPHRFRLIDAVDEVLAGLFSRPLRSALTTLGAVLGLASLIATVGLSRTAGSQIIDQFDELQASQVIVRARSSGQGDSLAFIAWDVEGRLDRLNGVVASGAAADVPNSGPVRAVAFVDPSGETDHLVPVVAASPGLIAAVRGNVAAGRWFDRGHVDRSDRVAVIGVRLAQELSIGRLDEQPGIYIGDHFFSVIGIVDEAPRDRGLLGSVIVPNSSAYEVFGVAAPERVVIDVELGAGGLIGVQAPVALSPNAPEQLSVVAPVLPQAARDRVAGEVNSLFLLLGLVSLVVGALGIANVTSVTVLERTFEIGLRRALGARRRHIALQFLGESAAIGLMGGIIGASIGVIVVVSVSSLHGWTPVLDPWIPLLAPPAGGLIGVAAGAYPAFRAARLEPVEALRGA